MMHILPDISRGKGNQAMKFGQLIECNMRNIFLGKIVHKTSFFFKKKNSELSISLDQQSEVSHNFLLLYVKVGNFHLHLFHIKLFWKVKRGLELVSLPHFLLQFWGNIFSRYILLTDEISLPDSLYFFRYLIICFVIQFVTSWFTEIYLFPT